MDFFQIIWDDEGDPDGNVEHIAEHGLSPEDVDYMLAAPTSEGVSRSTGLPIAWGYTSDGTYILVVYEVLLEDTIRIVTAYVVPEP